MERLASRIESKFEDYGRDFAKSLLEFLEDSEKRESFSRSDKVPGLIIGNDFLSELEETRLLQEIDEQEWSNALDRRTQHYGYIYDYKAKGTKAEPTQPMPPLIASLAKRVSKTCKELGISLKPDQAIVNEYLPGQGISAHVDSKILFGSVVVSISLGSQAVMEFKATQLSTSASFLLPRRSMIILSGDARNEFTHEIAKRKTDAVDGKRVARGRRVSITFRAMK